MRLLAIFLTLWCVTHLPASEYVGVFWNVHSGDSEASTIARQMSEKGPVDFWGLSEVPNQSFLDELVARIRVDHGINYVAQLSESGRNSSDHLAIVFNADRLVLEPYGGLHPVSTLKDVGGNMTDFFEVKTVQVTPGLRASLGCQLEGKKGERVVVLVNHWKAFSSGQERRKKQAEATDIFVTQTPGVPVIVGGDHNIVIKDQGQGPQQGAFEVLESQFDYLVPTNASNVGTFRTGSILDSVFLANDLVGVESTVTILERNGKQPASSSSFVDTNRDSDHRPVCIHISADADEQIDALEQDIVVLEAVLARMKITLERLKSRR